MAEGRGKRAGPSEPVVLSCIIENEGREVLICSEAPAGAPTRTWEFPTGLKKQGESPEAGMKRIAQDRAGVSIDIHTGQPPIADEYQGKKAVYRFFLATLVSGEVDTHDYKQVRWVQPGQLCEYDYAPVFQSVVDWYTEA